MKAAKRGIVGLGEQFIAGFGEAGTSALYDARMSGPTFEETIDKRRRDLLAGKTPSQPTDYTTIPQERAALDSRAETEDYQDMVARIGREMQGGARDPYKLARFRR